MGPRRKNRTNSILRNTSYADLSSIFFFRNPGVRYKDSMEHQSRLNISKSPCIKSGLELSCIKCRHRFQVLVISVVVGIMTDKGIVPSFVFIDRPIRINKMSIGR